MNSKIIKKLLAYTKQNELLDLTIFQKDGNHVVCGENGIIKHKLKLPARLENELGLAYRKLLTIAPTDLTSIAYFKDQGSTFKISIIPYENGEKVVINTVTKTKRVMPLSRLGLGRNEKKIIENFIKRRRGLIIIGADDNQGKTTTLYSLLQKINKEKRTCYLLEKHSELELDGINKIISNGERRFADLHQIIKSDSEVIAIDDANNELLEEALKIAQEGRLIITSTKISDTLSLVERIKRISSLEKFPILLIHQKLLNKNCPHCLKSYLINESEELITKYWPKDKSYKPKKFFSSIGCQKCNHSGIAGQIASFNLIEINQKEVNILSTLASDVLQKAANGLISISKYITEHKSVLNKKL